ncbi:MAG: M1 family aminopeptidase [Nitrospira sp.]
MKRIARRARRCARTSSSRMPAPSPIRCGPTLYHEINNFYTTTVYEKGAEVVRMIKTLLGAEEFRKGMDLYFERHDGEAATIEQFVQCFADATQARFHAVHALVFAGRHAGGDRRPALTMRRRRPTALEIGAGACRRRPASPSRSRW